MISAAVHILTGLAALCGFLGAYYWLKASNVPIITKPDVGGNEQFNAMMRQADMMGQIAIAARLNAMGARYAGIGAIAAGLVAALAVFA